MHGLLRARVSSLKKNLLLPHKTGEDGNDLILRLYFLLFDLVKFKKIKNLNNFKCKILFI